MTRRRLLPWLLASFVLALTWRELGGGLVQAAKDLSGHDFSETWYLTERWRQWSLPLWLPNARLGQPFLALLYTQALYPPRVLTGLLFGPVVGPNVMHLLHACWAFAGLVFAARRLGLRGPVVFIASAPFSLSPFFIEFAQNLSFASSAAWAGWVLWAALGLRRDVDLRATAWLALMLGGAFHGGAPEMLLWESLLVVLVLIEKRGAWGWGLLALGWGGALGAVVAFPALELAREYTVAGAPSPGMLEWSLSPTQLLSVAIPDADWPRAGPYWGGADQRFLFSLFIGSLPVLLACVGATHRRARPFALLVAFCVLLALGKHFGVSRVLLEAPPFRLFRYPVKYAVGALFGLSVLAGFGARHVWVLHRRRPELLHALLAGMVGIAAGLWCAARLPEVRAGLRDGTWWLTLGALSLAVVGARTRLLATLVALELVLVPHERWPRLSAVELQRPSELGQRLRIEAQRVSIRVDLDDRDVFACGPWDLDDAGDRLLLEGRKRLSSLRFVEDGLRATGGYGFRDPWRLTRAFGAGSNAFALAGVTHFVRNTREAPPIEGAVPRLEEGLDDVWTWTWSGARPRGWVATRAVVLDDDAAFARLAQPLDPTEVIVSWGPGLSGDCVSTPVTTTEVSPEFVQQHVDACGEGYVVLADAWFPGWRVEVDGVAADPVRAFGFLRAVQVTAGPHVVDWRYRPRSVELGAAVTLVALLAAIVAVRRKGRQNARVK